MASSVIETILAQVCVEYKDKPFSCGSACQVGRRLMLTALHVIEGKKGEAPVNKIQIAFLNEQSWIDAEVFWKNKKYDACLLRLPDDHNSNLIPFARFNRLGILEAEVHGFPAALNEVRTNGGIRRSPDTIHGRINTMAGAQERSLYLDIPPEGSPRTRENIEGLSGGPVIAKGYLLGIVIEIPCHDRNRLKITPIDTLLREFRKEKNSQKCKINLKDLPERKTRIIFVISFVSMVIIAIIAIIFSIIFPGYQNNNIHLQDDEDLRPPDDMVSVPAGNFIRGCVDKDRDCLENIDGDSREKPKKTIYLDAFEIDRTEVSIGNYKKCIKAKKCQNIDEQSIITKCQEEGKKKEKCYGICRNVYDKSKENHPMVCVTQLQAQKYCNWLAKKLPTEAQWEKAARGGGNSERIYPWGDDPASCDRAVMDLSNASGCGTGNTKPVKSDEIIEKQRELAGKSIYGAIHMAGNVSELTSDFFNEKFYESKILKNPKNELASGGYVVRGGSFINGYKTLRISNRSGTGDQQYGSGHIGFRCVRDSVV